MAASALSPIIQFPPNPCPYEHYRIANADYALVGWESEIGPAARQLSNQFTESGCRLGVLTLHRLDFDPEPFCQLLQPLSRIVAVGSLITHHLRQILPADSGAPHLFEVTSTITLEPDHLSDAVHAMLDYRTDRLHFGPSNA